MSLKLDNTMGAVFVGVVTSATLYGVSCVQAWYYFVTYPKDRWFLKLLVGAVFVSDSVHQILISHTLYTYLVTNYSNVEELGNLVWSLIVEVLFNGFTGLMAQSFFAYRIYQLSNKSRPLTALVLSLISAEFGATLTYVIKGLQMSNFIQLDTLKSLSMTVNALAAVGDVIIAIAMVILLHSSRTGFRRSDTVINTLIIFSLNTGLLTSLCAVLSLITIAALPTTFIYICFYFMLGRLYSNSLFATLNARHRLRNDGSIDPPAMSLSMSRIRKTTGVGSSNKGATEIAIQIDTTKDYSESTYPQTESFNINKPGDSLECQD